MFATIINHDDIEIFLSDKEIEALNKISLKGEIVEFEDVKKRYSLEILIENMSEWKKYARSNTGIGIHIKNDAYSIYIGDVVPSTSYYKELKEKSWIGTRYGNIKIDIMSFSFVEKYQPFFGYLRILKLKEEKYKNQKQK
jgi:hypothetical protein